MIQNTPPYTPSPHPDILPSNAWLLFVQLWIFGYIFEELSKTFVCVVGYWSLWGFTSSAQYKVSYQNNKNLPLILNWTKLGSTLLNSHQLHWYKTLPPTLTPSPHSDILPSNVCLLFVQLWIFGYIFEYLSKTFICVVEQNWGA